jgi:hypothetical protein
MTVGDSLKAAHVQSTNIQFFVKKTQPCKFRVEFFGDRFVLFDDVVPTSNNDPRSIEKNLSQISLESKFS